MLLLKCCGTIGVQRVNSETFSSRNAKATTIFKPTVPAGLSKYANDIDNLKFELFFEDWKINLLSPCMTHEKHSYRFFFL